MVDDGSAAVSLPEVPLLAVLPGTGGLTRLVDKRRVRKDLADVVATRSEGVRAKTALSGAWSTRSRRRAGSPTRCASGPAPPPPGPGGRPAARASRWPRWIGGSGKRNRLPARDRRTSTGRPAW